MLDIQRATDSVSWFKESRCLSIPAMLVAVLFGPSPAWADGPTVRVYKGLNMTGINRLFDKPLADYGGVVGTTGWNAIAEYVENSDDSVPLTPETPGSATLSVFFDEGLLNFLGFPADLADLALKNTPLRQNLVAVEATGLQKQAIPRILEAGQLERSQREPADPITLDEWFRAEGFIVVVCPEEGSPVLQLSASGLLPNRLYELVEWVTEPEFKLSPLPVGGVPSLIMSDDNGRANFRTFLNYCPPEPGVRGENPILYELGWHSDHQTNGGTLGAPLTPHPEDFRAPGQVVNGILEFIVSGTTL